MIFLGKPEEQGQRGIEGVIGIGRADFFHVERVAMSRFPESLGIGDQLCSQGLEFGEIFFQEDFRQRQELRFDRIHEVDSAETVERIVDEVPDQPHGGTEHARLPVDAQVIHGVLADRNGAFDRAGLLATIGIGFNPIHVLWRPLCEPHNN